MVGGLADPGPQPLSTLGCVRCETELINREPIHSCGGRSEYLGRPGLWLVHSDPDDPSEAALQANLLKQVAETLADDELPVFDAGFKVRQLQAVQLPRWVVRLAKNRSFAFRYVL